MRRNPKFGMDILKRLNPLEELESLTLGEFFHEKDEFAWGISLGELRAVVRHMRLITNERDFFQRAYSEVLKENLEYENQLRKLGKLRKV